MPPPANELPDCPVVSISRWALAGAALGHPVYLLFRDYPAPVVAELFRKQVRWVGKDAVLPVLTERDLGKLERRSGDLRLVLILEPRLLARAAWLLEVQRPSHAGLLPATPALFAAQPARGCQDVAGPTLIMHGYSHQITGVTEWIESGVPLGPPFKFEAPVDVLFDPRLVTAITGARPNQAGGGLGVRERQILQGLWAGAASTGGAGGLDRGGPLAVGPDAYRAVYRPLRSASVQPADQAFDPTALAMVERANAYLRMRAAEHTHRLTEPDGPGITRRELTDLGNVRGDTVRTLLAHLLGQGPEGFTVFQSLGLRRGGPGNQGWPTRDPASLADWLLPWTEKMVRDRFVRMCREGMVTGRRGALNQALVYQLPEAIGRPSSPFASLPDPDAVALTQVAGLTDPPRLAQVVGQAEAIV